MRTPLYDAHQALGATFVPFAGYDMPVHYGSIKEEHEVVRTSAGRFDVSHMSNLRLTDGVALSKVTPKDLSGLEVGKGAYSVILNDDGTILDDIFVFRLEDHYFVVPNAGMNGPVQARLAEVGCAATDESADWAIIAVQGPTARELLASLADELPKFHRIIQTTVAGVECLVSGTGYTGEKGVEIYVPADGAATVWNALDIPAIGLGARDTLRLEKGYCLAGHEFAGGRTPLEAGLHFIVDFEHEFAGKEALLAQREQGHPQLMGLLQERGVPREGYTVRKHRDVGIVTSGTMSPGLGKGIALAYLEDCEIGDAVEVDVRGRMQPATVVKLPFV